MPASRCAPDLCIMNYYTAEAKMGVHQDKDERPETIAAGDLRSCRSRSATPRASSIGGAVATRSDRRR